MVAEIALEQPRVADAPGPRPEPAVESFDELYLRDFD